jgi:hypothetical protein
MMTKDGETRAALRELSRTPGSAMNSQRYRDELDLHAQDAPHPLCHCDTCHDARVKQKRRNALPPVNVRAEQVHRIRQRLTNIRAYIGPDIDDVALSGIGFVIEDLIEFERNIRDQKA